MNETTLFLAQIIGPTMAIIGLGMLGNSKYYMRVFKNFEKESFALMMFVMAMLVAGIALLAKHFMWGSLAEGIITIVGLGMVIKSVLLAMAPKAFEKLVDALVKPATLYFGGAVWLIAGAYLVWVGFVA